MSRKTVLIVTGSIVVALTATWWFFIHKKNTVTTQDRYDLKQTQVIVDNSKTDSSTRQPDLADAPGYIVEGTPDGGAPA